LYLQVENGLAVGTMPSPAHPVARGRLCVKGWHAHEAAANPRRLTRPLIRRGGAALEPASWSEALDLVASRLLAIKAEHGPGAIGVLGSARGSNEDNYLLARLARGALGTNNIDTAARLEALPGLFDLPQYRHLTGSGAPPWADGRPTAGLAAIDEADLIVLWQTDPVEEHPAAAARVLRAAQRGVPVIEVAWRASQLAPLAALRLTPRPGSDIVLAGALVQGAFQGEGTPPSEEFAAALADLTPERAENATGVAASLIEEAGRLLTGAARPLILYTRGVTLQPQATDVLAALAALAGPWGGGAGDTLLPHGDGSWPRLIWLGRYSNLQGARDMGVAPYFLPGFRPVSDERARARVAEVWGAPIPAEGGLSAWEMLGTVRALLVMGDDPLVTLPDIARARKALAGLSFLAVLDSVSSPITEAAHVVLPTAGFAEEDGTFTSAEHRVQRLRAGVRPPGEARPGWQVICELSGRLGRPLDYPSPASVMAEIASLVPAYAGVSYQALDDNPGGLLVAPQAGTAQPNHGKALEAELSFALDQAPTPETDDEFPYLLAPDYALRSWAGEALVAASVSLRRELAPGRPFGFAQGGALPLPQVEMGRADAREHGLRDGEQVAIRSRTGEMRASLRLSDGVRSGVLALPYSMREAAAAVMPPALHPETGVPLLAPCAVSIHRV
jgi:predicted molibdopterin-dependent oxidoreductase YjgC